MHFFLSFSLFLLFSQTATVTVLTKAERQVSSIAQSTMCSPANIKASTNVALKASESLRPQPFTPLAPSADSSIDRTPPEKALSTQPTRISSAEMWKVAASVEPCAKPASLEPEAVDFSKTTSDQTKLETRTIIERTSAASTALKALPGGKEEESEEETGLGCLRSQSTFLVVTMARRM